MMDSISHRLKTYSQRITDGDFNKDKIMEFVMKIGTSRHRNFLLLLLCIQFFFICYVTTRHSTVDHRHSRVRRSTNDIDSIKGIKDSKEYLLILCTTLVPSIERDIVHVNTMRNWKNLDSDILPVLFLDEKYIETRKTFTDNGWVVFPVEHASHEGNPIVREFFRTIKTNFRSQYIGYANSDILFNDDLAKTLRLIDNSYRPFIERTNEIFVSGSRYDVENITSMDFSTHDKILQAKLNFSTRHSPMGQDYFITDYFYAWEMIPEIVVGKQRIDNWILINAYEFNHTAIDSSEAITAIHQTVDKGSWAAARRNTELTDPMYNENLLKKVQQDFIYFQTGNLDCLPYELNYTVSHDLVLIQRPRIAPFCKRQDAMVEVLRQRKEKIDRQQKLMEIKKQRMEEQRKLQKKLDEIRKMNNVKAKQIKEAAEKLKAQKKKVKEASDKLAVHNKYFMTHEKK